MKLIDKDALVAEINRILSAFENSDAPVDRLRASTLIGLLSFLDTLEVIEVGVDFGDPKGDKSAKCIIDTKTLEVKEVDFEKEFNRFLNEVEGVPRMWHSDEQIEWAKDLAKHFFELGLKAQNKED